MYTEVAACVKSATELANVGCVLGDQKKRINGHFLSENNVTKLTCKKNFKVFL